jgi:S1-C subfamily serine protease
MYDPPFQDYFKDFKLAPSHRRPTKRSKPGAAVPAETGPGQLGTGYLGIKMLSIDEEISERLGMKEIAGVLVMIVNPESPAERGGLMAGDVIIRFDGKNISTLRDLSDLILATQVGRAITIDVWRDRVVKNLTVTLESIQADSAPTWHQSVRPAK